MYKRQPVAIGMLLGIGLFSYPIEYLLEHYQVYVLWSFAGAIIGTVPSLVKEATQDSERDKVDLIWFWVTFIAVSYTHLTAPSINRR